MPAVQEAGYAQYRQEAPQDTVTVSMASLRSALHALADDDAFLRTVMSKLKSSRGK